MVTNKLSDMSVEVAYATPDHQLIIPVQIAMGSCISVAIERSGILTIFPEIDLTRHKVGVFGQIKQLSDIAHVGDRIEIYRPLTIDPKIARRVRAKNIK